MDRTSLDTSLGMEDNIKILVNNLPAMLRRISLNKHVFWHFLSILNVMRSKAGVF
jgi:hypothetical protein